MAEAYLRADYQSLTHPFAIEGRRFEAVEVETWIIARVTAENARLLAASGLPWRHGEEPDWDRHERKISVMRAEEEVRRAQAALKTALERQKETTDD